LNKNIFYFDVPDRSEKLEKKIRSLKQSNQTKSKTPNDTCGDREHNKRVTYQHLNSHNQTIRKITLKTLSIEVTTKPYDRTDTYTSQTTEKT